MLCEQSSSVAEEKKNKKCPLSQTDRASAGAVDFAVNQLVT